MKGSGDGLVLEMRDGIMKAVAREAAKHAPAPYIVLIDEINRANVPRVFGELLTVIELDKRNQPVRLPASGESLSVPDNLFILGTMNTADKSIRSLDSALRRRFAFVELMPDLTVLEGAVVDGLDLSVLLTKLNSRVVGIAGREQQIGHSYFLDRGAPIESTEELADVIRQEIIPLLQEIAFDDYGQLRNFLGRALVDDQNQRLTDVVNDDTELIVALAREYQAAAGSANP